MNIIMSEREEFVWHDTFVHDREPFVFEVALPTEEGDMAQGPPPPTLSQQLHQAIEAHHCRHHCRSCGGREEEREGGNRQGVRKEREGRRKARVCVMKGKVRRDGKRRRQGSRGLGTDRLYSLPLYTRSSPFLPLPLYSLLLLLESS